MNKSTKKQLRRLLPHGLLLLLLVTQVQRVFTQVTEPRLDVNMTNTTLQAVFELIEKQTSYRVNYSEDEVKGNTNVSVKMKQATVQQLLTVVLKQTGYEFVRTGNVYIIKKKPVIRSAASKGQIVGKISDSESGEPLAGATIKIEDQLLLSETDGSFSLSLPEGNYKAELSVVGYIAKQVTDIIVKEKQTATLNLLLQRDKGQLKGVVVTASAQKENTAALLVRQKNNTAITDGISGELIRRTPDRNAGDAIKRITGVSVLENKYVVVRGLADRYNYTLLNGSLLPSTEPDRRTFSLDLIPAQAIESIEVIKTATANLPGEFAGGVVQINTRDFPDKDFTTVTIGTGFYEGQTGKAFIKDSKGKSDWWGSDNGGRALPKALDLSYAEMNKLYPEERFKISEALSKGWSPVDNGKAQPIMQLQLGYGKTFHFKNQAKLGIVALASYRKDETIDYVERHDIARFRNKDTLAFLRSYDDEKDYRYVVNRGAMLNIAYQFGKNKISVKSLYNRDFETVTYIKNGEKSMGNDFIDIVPNTVLNMHLTQKTLLGTQVQGEHQFGLESPVTLSWNVSYNKVKKYEPGETRLGYVNINQEGFSPEFGGPDMGSRLFSDLKEEAYNVNFAIAAPFTIAGLPQIFKGGAFTQFRKRNFFVRNLGFFDAGRGVTSPSNSQGFPTSVGVDFLQPIEDILVPENFRPGGLVAVSYELPANLYDGGTNLASAFVNMESNILQNLRLIYGARVEFYTMSLSTSKELSRRLVGSGSSGDDQSPIDYIRYNTDLLPSLNLIYSPHATINLRAAYSKTLTRPIFREISPYAYFDNVSGYTTLGNPALERGTIQNMDFRAEWYPAAGEIIAASIFRKKLKDPVEPITVATSEFGKFLRYYRNTPGATNWGMEFELRKSLYVGGAATWLRNIIVFGNYTIIHSAVSNNTQIGSNAEAIVVKKRPLAGQSPYLLNAGLLVNAFKNTFSFSAALNRAGRRIVIVGTTLEEASVQGAYPDIYENPRNQLDMQVAQKLFKQKLEIRINAANLLNTPYIQYQDFDLNNKYSGKLFDATVYSKRSYSSYTITFSYNF
jgi:outer membrane receptor protein involved in Fe transport